MSMFTNSNWTVKAFIFVYCVIFILTYFYEPSVPALEFSCHFLLVLLFVLVARRNIQQGLYIFLILCIVMGVNGRVHSILNTVPNTAIFLLILVIMIFFNLQQQPDLRRRLKNSRASIMIILTGILLPLVGVAVGFSRGNNFSYLFCDLDGWVFYIIFFLLLFLIHDDWALEQFIKMYISVIIIVSIGLTSISLVLWFGLVDREVISFLLYDIAGLGGHLETTWGNMTRVYTGNGIFCVVCFCYCLSLLFSSQQLSRKRWIIGLLFSGTSLFFSFSRGFWAATLVGVIFVIVLKTNSIPVKKCLLGLITIITVTVIILIIPSRIPKHAWNELRRCYTEIFYFSRISLLYAGSPGGGVLKSSDGGHSWKYLGRGLPSHDVRAFDIVDNELLVVLNGQMVFLSKNDGQSWKQIFEGLVFDKMITQINEFEDKTIYVGLLKGKKYRIHGRSIGLKLKQYQALFKYGLKKPIMGHGFGATLPEQKTYRKTDGMPYVFEAGYGDLFYKLGFTGIILWFYLVLITLWRGVLLLRFVEKKKAVQLRGILAAMAGLLIVYGSNPFLYSPFGIIPLVIAVFYVDLLGSFYKEDVISGCKSSHQ